AEIDQAVAAWQQQAIKTCSLDAVFPKLALQHASPPREGWDLGVVTRLTDPNRIWVVGGSQVLFLTFPAVDRHGDDEEYTQNAKHPRADGPPFEATLDYHNGHCTIRVGDTAIFDDLLHAATVSGAVPAASGVGQAIQLAVVAAKDVPSEIGAV